MLTSSTDPTRQRDLEISLEISPNAERGVKTGVGTKRFHRWSMDSSARHAAPVARTEKRLGPADSDRWVSVARCIDWPIWQEKNAAVANTWPQPAEWPAEHCNAACGDPSQSVEYFTEFLSFLRQNGMKTCNRRAASPDRTVLVHGVFGGVRSVCRFTRAGASEPANEADENELQAPSVADDEELFCYKSESRREGPQATGTEDGTLEEGASGLVPKRSREMATKHDEAGGQHDDEQRRVSRHARAVEHGRLAERRTGGQHPRRQQQHAIDLDGGAARSSSPTFRRFLSGLVLRSLLTTA
ncbi:hypothetical protein K0M31_016638 [Melipona bicolor]|uniref:Uncharacterized protein n=1 Tax=Melipona bicolor TaxID=60889 RepID=A0AA40FF65_9HYME|nr:hypothetical protein K0M31_016638 [Melipona bicolor]